MTRSRIGRITLAVVLFVAAVWAVTRPLIGLMPPPLPNRLSLRLRPDDNLAHARLALLLDRTGRNREAAGEARTALTVLDGYTRQAARDPPVEGISPFRSPIKLREALERVAAGACRNVIDTAFSWRAMYGIIPSTTSVATSVPSAADLPWRLAMRSEIVVTRCSFATRTSLLTTTGQVSATSVRRGTARER
jgi:hypothetical protein